MILLVTTSRETGGKFCDFIGVGIAFITRQIDYSNTGQMMVLVFVSIIVLSVIVLLMLEFKWHMSNIFDEIKKLKL